MAFIGFLYAFPLVAAVLLYILRDDGARNAIVCVSAGVITVAAVACAAVYMNAPATFELSPGATAVGSYLAVAVDLLLCGVVLNLAFRWKNPLAIVLGLVQLALSIWAGVNALGEVGAGSEAAPLYIDNLSIIMVLIVGLVGSAICVYALGYMRDFQAHEPEGAPDRRHVFHALMFLFLSAMFVIVTSDNMDWLLAAWELTTVCSFLMIGYTRTPEARRSALLQINLNMIGGIAFYAAVIWMHAAGLPLSLSAMIEAGAAGGAEADALILPVMLLSVAGLTKAAQMPFHRWLLGAMVAPTPTSALLHSSTMVKAGVFLLIKLAPLYLVYPVASIMVTLIGGITFLLASLMAISQSNAKRVLAYSTIANLGLISACAGVGTDEAVWAGIFLIIFHTVSKSLLFLCVGTVEHRIGSRDIEDMDGLFARLPRLTRCMMLGIMGMFVAPFGMLISKWATLVSFAETGNVIFLIMLAFGSAATFFFWTKWLGKLVGVPQKAENVEGGVHRSEWAAIGTIVGLMLAACLLLPAISRWVIGPYLEDVYHDVPYLIDTGNLIVMVASVIFVAVVLLTPWGRSNGKRRQAVFLGGQCADPDGRRYHGSMGRTMTSTKRNWYLEDMFGEGLLTRIGVIVCASILVMCLASSFIFDTDYLSGGSWFHERSVVMAGPDLLGLVLGTLAFAVAAPIVGCLLDGLDRKVSAGMQGRVGPRLLQPYWDVRKLLSKEQATVNSVDEAYVTCALVFCAVAGGMIVSGSNMLMSIFLVTLATLFVVMAAYSARSPYADMGADREILQVMSYEPMLMIMAAGLFVATQSFDVAELTKLDAPIILSLGPIFAGMVFVLTIKLRKSPFDLSYSHHAHQELVKGITTEMSGRTLAKVEVLHWAESALFLMWTGTFFVWSNPASFALALAAVALLWFLEVWIDNDFARTKWQNCLKSAWLVALVVGVVNLFYVIVTPFV